MSKATPRLSFAITRYITEGTQRGHLAETTARSYRSILGRFADSLGDPPVGSLTKRHISKWLGTLKCGPATTRHRMSTVQTFCRWAVEEGYLRRDPAASFKPPRQPRFAPKAMPPDDVARLLAVCPDARARLIVTLMVQLGLRAAEVSNMDAADIDFDNRLLLVHGKGNKERVLPITDETWSALHAYLAEWPINRSGPLIRSYQRHWKSLSPGYIGDRVRRWMLAAGVKERARDGRSGHALRHTAATDVLRGGADVRVVQEMLGHGSLQTTQRYLAWDVSGLRDAMEGRDYRSQPA